MTRVTPVDAERARAAAPHLAENPAESPAKDAAKDAAESPAQDAAGRVAARGPAAAVTGDKAADSGGVQLATFLDLSAQMFCVLDFTSALVWWNAAFERTLGYSRDELLHMHLDDLVHPDDRDTYQANEATLAENGEAGLTQVRFLTRQGEWRWLEWTTRVDFERQRAYGAARDITDRRRDEMALRESEARPARHLAELVLGGLCEGPRRALPPRQRRVRPGDGGLGGAGRGHDRRRVLVRRACRRRRARRPGPAGR